MIDNAKGASSGVLFWVFIWGEVAGILLGIGFPFWVWLLAVVPFAFWLSYREVYGARR